MLAGVPEEGSSCSNLEGAGPLGLGPPVLGRPEREVPLAYLPLAPPWPSGREGESVSCVVPP
jgi:hypothetical protein